MPLASAVSNRLPTHLPRLGMRWTPKIPEREDAHQGDVFCTQGGKPNDTKIGVATVAFTNIEGGWLFMRVSNDGEPVRLKRPKAVHGL